MKQNLRFTKYRIFKIGSMKEKKVKYMETKIIYNLSIQLGNDQTNMTRDSDTNLEDPDERLYRNRQTRRLKIT